MAGPCAPWIFPVSLAPGAPWAPASLARLRSSASRNLGCISSAGVALSPLSPGCSGLAALLAMEASCRRSGRTVMPARRGGANPSQPEEAWRALGFEAAGPTGLLRLPVAKRALLRVFALPVQRRLQFPLVFLGQRGLQDGAAVLAHRLDRLVGRDLLQHQEQARCARLEHVTDLLLELLVDAGLAQLAHQGAHPGADGHAEDRDEEQQAEQEPPEHAPRRSGTDDVMVGADVVAAVGIAGDHRDRVWLYDQVLGQSPCLAGCRLRGRLIRVADG